VEGESTVRMKKERLLILIGAYGSGKTECALALAVEAAVHEPVTLVDLDFVTPYFRSQDYHDEMVSLGVRVIAPDATRAAIDAPTLSPEAVDALMHPTGLTIVDLGGDPAGAVVLAQFTPLPGPYEAWAVVNFSRPTTPDVVRAASVIGEIAAAARLTLTGLVSNTHLGPYTTEADVRAGLAETKVLSALLHIPVMRVAVPPTVTLVSVSIPVLPLPLRVKRPWER
jgi:hypothetical protein